MKILRALNLEGSKCETEILVFVSCPVDRVLL